MFFLTLFTLFSEFFLQSTCRFNRKLMSLPVFDCVRWLRTWLALGSKHLGKHPVLISINYTLVPRVLGRPRIHGELSPTSADQRSLLTQNPHPSSSGSCRDSSAPPCPSAGSSRRSRSWTFASAGDCEHLKGWKRWCPLGSRAPLGSSRP